MPVDIEQSGGDWQQIRGDNEELSIKIFLLGYFSFP